MLAGPENTNRNGNEIAMKRMLSIVAVIGLSGATAEAKLQLPRVFGDNVVRQRDKPVNVWGVGDRGDSVTVTFGGQTKKTKVGADGKWILKLELKTQNFFDDIWIIKYL